ncbi:YceI family protein [Methylotenera versatilis]|uniref:YceI family protein n=1 Tax=Methylotenera versatilis TaxID=1055487 RepID=UPI0006460902|nr:YceI family protein [Methylotenera versatilis]
MRKISVATALVLASSYAIADPETYKIDNSHSFANWSIRHVASKTSGTFSDVTGKIIIDRDNLANSSVDAKINVLSVNSSHAKRDEHIKKAEYLDAAKFGEMTFVSKKIEAKSATEGVMTGVLTLHGVSKEMTFPFKVLGFGSDPWGGYRSGFEAHTSLKASDFGFGWGAKANASVGDDVEITLLIEGVKLPAETVIK